nr:MAG TPA: hypothetical protein [Caudoviricetes sp.]
MVSLNLSNGGDNLDDHLLRTHSSNAYEGNG